MAPESAAAGSGVAAIKAIKREATVYGVVSATELEKPYDMVIIGGGPAGIAAAQKAAFLGRRALIVDDAPCAPTELDLSFGAPTGLFSKALRDTAKTIDVDLLSKMGLDKRVVWAQVQASVANLARNNALTVMEMLKEFKISYLRAKAVVEGHAAGEGDDGSVTTLVATLRDGTTHKLSASHVLIVTGSMPTRPDSVPFDEQRVFDSDSIAKLAFLPKRVVISGAGIIGIEYAKIFAKLKCEVTIMIRGDAATSLARLFDSDIVNGLVRGNRTNPPTLTCMRITRTPAELQTPPPHPSSTTSSRAASTSLLTQPPRDSRCPTSLTWRRTNRSQ